MWKQIYYAFPSDLELENVATNAAKSQHYIYATSLAVSRIMGCSPLPQLHQLITSDECMQTDFVLIFTSVYCNTARACSRVAVMQYHVV